MAAVDLNVLAADSLLMGTAALARKYGKSERWIRMLKSKPDFAEARARAAAQAFDEAISRAQIYALEAVEVLHDVMTDAGAAPGARSQSAMQLLSVAVTMNEQRQIMDKMARIEQTFEGVDAS